MSILLGTTNVEDCKNRGPFILFSLFLIELDHERMVITDVWNSLSVFCSLAYGK